MVTDTSKNRRSETTTKLRNVRTVLLLAMLAAFARSASPQSEAGSAPECESESGPIIAGASSGWIEVPFRGRLLLRFKDGTVKPASVAAIAPADEPCPHTRSQQLDLTSKGRFETTMNLLTDSYWYCVEGKRVGRRTVESLKLTLLVPGCEDLDFTLSEDSKPFQLEVHCDMAAADYKPKSFTTPPARAGAHVDFRGSDLYIEGTEVTLPVPVATLESLLGKSRIRPAQGDAHSNDVYEWEGEGIFGYSQAGSGVIHAIGLLLHRESDERHWCNPGIVELTVNGFQIDSHSEPSILNKAGFEDQGYAWKRRSGGIYATVISHDDPQILSSVEIGVQ